LKNLLVGILLSSMTGLSFLQDFLVAWSMLLLLLLLLVVVPLSELELLLLLSVGDIFGGLLSSLAVTTGVVVSIDWACAKMPARVEVDAVDTAAGVTAASFDMAKI